ncbi:Ribosome biogenesis protein [Podosphaera aphanis]|nr:Ribosome biogenesis protein [Podosphaera aphanis]
MGKKKYKISSDAKDPSQSDGFGLPSFDEKALTALTSRIEESLEMHKLQPPVARTKRDAAGNAKVSGKPTITNTGSSSRPKHSEDKASKETLLKEILALGGTEEDLELVEDLSSEDNEEKPSGEKPREEKPKKEKPSQEKSTTTSKEKTTKEKTTKEKTTKEKTTKEKTTKEITTKVETSKEKLSSHLDHSNRLIFEARSDWYAASLPPLPTHKVEDQGNYSKSISKLKDYAMSLLEADSQLYASKHLLASSSHRFLSTIMASGTLSDKVSALTLVVQESPVHTTKSFESLLGLAKKRSRGQAVTALAALKDLLGTGTVLPPDRRLKNFIHQPGLLATLSEDSVRDWNSGQRLPGNISKLHLIYWAFEDWLKQSYFEMLKILESWCNDEVEYARSRVVSYVYELLRDKPEQEANLLRLLVNKLGDPDKKISSRASYLILQLQVSHPLMKPIIIRSIETELLLRPGQNIHAKYYAINTLNQTILSSKEDHVAKTLIRIYFELFVSLLKRPEVLKPSNTTTPAPKVNRKGDIQGGGGPVGKKAKAKLNQLEEAKLANEELNEKMISAVLTGVNRAFPFLNSDDEDISLENHMDTLFKITHSSNFNTSVQALMLIERFATTKNLSVDRFYRTLYESLLDPRLVTSSKHALYLNLLFRSLRSDTDTKRVKAFAKRMMQILTLHQPPFICGTLYLLKELETNFPGLRSLRIDPEDDGLEEKFVDAPEEADSHIQTDYIQTDDQAPQSTSNYDGRKRDPQYSNAHNSCLWEIIPFLAHFHPSVSLFAKRLLEDEKMPPKPDLASHSLSSFLDRFVYRNAKAASKESRGSSIMQPLAGNDNQGILLTNKGVKHKQQPLNCEAFWRQKAEDVAVDEVFFHKYYSQIGKSKQSSKKKSKEVKDPDDFSGEDEDEIWEALVKSKPDIEENNSDAEMPDFDDYESDSTQDDLEIDEETVENLDDIIESDASDGEAEIDELFKRELTSSKTDKVEDLAANNSKTRKKKMKGLPTFASFEDYASLLDNDNEDF